MEQVYGVADTVYKPKVFSKIVDHGVNFYLLYVCHYRRISGVRNKINARVIEEFNKDPRMQFAYPTERIIPTNKQGDFSIDVGK